MVAQPSSRAACALLPCAQRCSPPSAGLRLRWGAQVGEAEKELAGANATNQYANLVDEAEGLDKIEDLQNHEQEEIYDKAANILEAFFDIEDGEVENLAPQVRPRLRASLQRRHCALCSAWATQHAQVSVTLCRDRSTYALNPKVGGHRADKRQRRNSHQGLGDAGGLEPQHLHLWGTAGWQRTPAARAAAGSLQLWHTHGPLGGFCRRAAVPPHFCAVLAAYVSPWASRAQRRLPLSTICSCILCRCKASQAKL